MMSHEQFSEINDLNRLMESIGTLALLHGKAVGLSTDAGAQYIDWELEGMDLGYMQQIFTNKHSPQLHRMNVYYDIVDSRISTLQKATIVPVTKEATITAHFYTESLSWHIRPQSERNLEYDVERVFEVPDVQPDQAMRDAIELSQKQELSMLRGGFDRIAHFAASREI